ncbi:hypothetical protein FRB93_006252 [Tulasnella sp. JGI-2019a]|nr:hypothetical protein FRB93_006252 [Tulasnella sp. JGI-2019a]
MKRPRFSTLCPSEVADAKRRFAREANTWSSLVHDKILLFHGMVEISNEIYLVSPWIEYGDLSKFVIERLKFMSASPSHQREHPRRIAYEAFKASTSIYGIASGLAYLHAANIIHGDMKALNVLLTEQLEPLICDFGMAKVLDGYNETSTTMKGAGSYRFMSPELMCDGPKTTESDIYAFGMTIVEILTGHIPLHGPNQVPFIRAILSGQRPPCEPIFRQGVGFGTLWVIASAYWASEPSERPSAGRVLEWMERMMETDIR